MATDIVSLGRQVLAAPGVALQSGADSATGGVAVGSGGGGSSGLADIILMAGPSQSNAGYSETQDGAFLAMAQAVSFYLQAGGTPAVLSVWANAGQPGTEVGGIGVMEIVTASAYSQSFLSNTAGANFSAETAASAPLGLCGTGYSDYATSLSGAQRGQINALVSYWGESDSLEYAPADKPIYKAAIANLFGQVRAMLGKIAAELPIIFFGAPYGLLPNWWSYPPSLREAWAEFADDPLFNFAWAVPQAYDVLSRNELWNGTTGLATGGNTDGGHVNAIDNVALFKRAALPAARAILASNGLDASLIPASLGTGLGPQIVGAALSGTTLTLAVEHDGGDDLIVPLLATRGVGFSLMDGGSTASPGSFIMATSCARIDATHLVLTLASAPSNPHVACRVMYPWPGIYWSAQPDAEIGRGCAVTDNFSAVSKPDGFDINAGLGAGWGANLPLRTPVTIASGVASYGIPLSA